MTRAGQRGVIDEAEHQRFATLAHAVYPGSVVRTTWPLKDGVSAQVTALEVEQTDGGTQKLVVRLYAAGDLSADSNIAAGEFRLLQLLPTAGLAVPKPLLADPTGSFGGTPCLDLATIEGRPPDRPADLFGFVAQLAAALARLHALDAARVDLSFLPDRTLRLTQWLAYGPERLDTALDEARIRQTLEKHSPLPPRNRAALLHGDFGPGNTL